MQVWKIGKGRERTPEGGRPVGDTEDMLDLVDAERLRLCG